MVAEMIRVSVDIIWATRLLLKRIIDYNLNNINDLYLPNISSANLDVLINLAELCNWIKVDGSFVDINERCYEIVSVSGFEKQAREMLADYIIKVAPIWAKRIPYGRKEAFIFMSKDEQACFYEAGLMNDNPNNTEIEWWDCIANYIRSQDDLHKNETGRKGEINTILYEKDRIGRNLQWVSIDSNLTGYDIISYISKENASKLLIEVKSSEMSINTADFCISAHEWHTACNSHNYVFHLWCFYDNKKQLAVIEASSLLPYIPTNNETGEWQTVRIPFKSFRQMFKEIA